MKKLLKILLIVVVVFIGLYLASVIVIGATGKFLHGRASNDDTAQSQAWARAIVDNNPQPTAPVYSRQALLEQTNQYRKNPLVLDPALNETAQKKCDYLVAHHLYEHGDITPLLKQLGVHIFGENLDIGVPEKPDVVNDWVNSPGHFKNMTDPRFTRVGFGFCKDFKALYGTMVVEHLSD